MDYLIQSLQLHTMIMSLSLGSLICGKAEFEPHSLTPEPTL